MLGTASRVPSNKETLLEASTTLAWRVPSWSDTSNVTKIRPGPQEPNVRPSNRSHESESNRVKERLSNSVHVTAYDSEDTEDSEDSLDSEDDESGVSVIVPSGFGV